MIIVSTTLYLDNWPLAQRWLLANLTNQMLCGTISMKSQSKHVCSENKDSVQIIGLCVHVSVWGC